MHAMQMYTGSGGKKTEKRACDSRPRRRGVRTAIRAERDQYGRLCKADSTRRRKKTHYMRLEF